jgi:Nif-specific regulatory protein
MIELREEGGVWSSPAAQEVLREIEWMAPTDQTVLITGRTGSGKSFVAKTIHALSPRKDKDFKVIPVATFSPTLVNNELFGHQRGAYTHATDVKEGLVEQARGGTVFLDEIGDIDPLTQVMLLQFLQEKKFRRVGGNQELEVDVRIVAATNRNLKALVEEGKFREDLYWRIATFMIEMPDLVQRGKDDIEALANHFLRRLVQSQQSAPRHPGGEWGARGFSKAAMGRISSYSWPGNIRQLERAVHWAFFRCGKGELIEVEHLPPLDESIVPLPEDTAARDVAPNAKDADLSAASFEKAYLEVILRMSGWKINEAAKILRLNRDTVASRMRKYGLEKPRD